MLEAALQLAELGYQVFPCVPGGKPPCTEHGLRDATRDEAQIEAWWKKWPTANVAIRTDGLLVIDVDGKDNQWFANLGERARELLATQISRTPSGGLHFLFRQPEGRSYANSQSLIGHKVDTRADGGYIVAPPSIFKGVQYKWLNGEIDVGPAALPLPPQWILDAIEDASRKNVASRRDTPATATKIPEGQRNGCLFRLGRVMSARGMSFDAILAALHAENSSRCSPPLPDREIEVIATSAASYSPNPELVAIAGGNVTDGEDESQYFVNEPQPAGETLLRIPGFVSELMDFCLDTAPYPNVALAFCGALSLQAYLSARKIRDAGDNRTNIYCLGLANSSAGKDWPRKLNTKILHELGHIGSLGERFASAEGIQDALIATPSMIFQTDEIDGLLQSINKARDARFEAIMGTLLTLHSSANSIYPIRRKAGQAKDAKKDKSKEVADLSINQPSLVLFGTAIPKHYYSALSERMLTNGLLARMLVIESGRRADGQEAKLIEALPDRVLEAAMWWSEMQCGEGNATDLNPEPLTVKATDEALQLLAEIRKTNDAEYRSAEGTGDAVATTVWGRASEHVRKLALIYAASECHQGPQISLSGVQWAQAIVDCQVRRMLYMAATHVVENRFDELCQRLKRLLSKATDHSLPRWKLLKALRVDAKMFETILNTLQQQGDIVEESRETNGRAGVWYRLIRI